MSSTFKDALANCIAALEEHVEREFPKARLEPIYSLTINENRDDVIHALPGLLDLPAGTYNLYALRDAAPEEAKS